MHGAAGSLSPAVRSSFDALSRPPRVGGRKGRLGVLKDCSLKGRALRSGGVTLNTGLVVGKTVARARRSPRNMGLAGAN